jgi:hypothetical protein
LNFRRRVLYFLRQLGFDPVLTWRAFAALPKFLCDLIFFVRKNGFKGVHLSPSIQDYSDNSGVTDGHYFWQDLIVAKWIFEQNPPAHLDVGSRLDGFVAHLLTFREVEIIDFRPTKNKIPNLVVHVGDATGKINVTEEEYESVSSLHSIEHFGLGRYGDPIRLNGHYEGLINIASKVKVDGILYVSFPIGRTVTEFNSQRVVDPMWAIEVLANFSILEFVLIPWTGTPVYGINPRDVNREAQGQAGIYKLVRIS